MQLTLTYSEITKQIVKHFNPVKIILFGSHGRGEANKYSDMDIMVVLDKVTDKWQHMADIRGVLNDIDVQSDIDILVSTPEDMERYKDDTGYIFFYVIRDGVVLYER